MMTVPCHSRSLQPSCLGGMRGTRTGTSVNVHLGKFSNRDFTTRKQPKPAVMFHSSNTCGSGSPRALGALASRLRVPHTVVHAAAPHFWVFRMDGLPHFWTIPYRTVGPSPGPNQSIYQSLHTSVPGMTGHLNLPSSDLCTVWYRTRWYLCDL